MTSGSGSLAEWICEAPLLEFAEHCSSRESGTLVRVNEETVLTIVSGNVGKLWQMRFLVV